MKPLKGRLLSHQESVSLRLLQSTDRDMALEAIVKFLRVNAKEGSRRLRPPSEMYRPRKQR